MFWMLIYDYVDDYMERRTPLRPEHFELANGAVERGELVLAGAVADPPDQGYLIFQADDVSVVEDFVKRDPYVREGVVSSWKIRSWTVVAGTKADLT